MHESLKINLPMFYFFLNMQVLIEIIALHILLKTKCINGNLLHNT